MRRIVMVAVATLVALATVAPTASAAPDRTISLSRYSTMDEQFETAARSGAAVTGVVSEQMPPCTPAVRECETALVHVEDLGRLRFTISDPTASPLLRDVDLFVYRSDASGLRGQLIGSSQGTDNYEYVTVPSSQSVADGYYLMEIVWYTGYGSVNGRVQLTPVPLTY